MRQRLTSGILGAIILIVVLVSDKIYVNIGVAIVGFLALLELYSAVGLTKSLPLKILGFIAALAFTFVQSFNNQLLLPVIYIYVLLLFVLYMMKSNELRLKDIAKMFFITTYVCFFLGHIVFVRKMANGEYLIWFIFISAFLTDVFAMLGGKIFGKHKLCPNLSPKKTIEGSIGGVFGSTLGIMVYCFILQYFFKLSPNYLNAFILAIVGSALAQFGDLAASVIKREFEIKDYGNIMPGHGGVMDRFDSVIFTAPIVYYFICIFPIL